MQLADTRARYEGCLFLLGYGYLTGPCEVCALKSNDIHIEEHHAVRTRYLDRTRGQERRRNDRLEIQSCSDESTVMAELSSDEDEDNTQLPASVPSSMEVDVEASSENEVRNINCAVPMASDLEQQSLEQESHSGNGSVLCRPSSHESESMELEGTMTGASTMAVFPPHTGAAAGDDISRGSSPDQNSHVLMKDAPSTHEPPRYISTFYRSSHNTPEVNPRLLPNTTSPASAMNDQILNPPTIQKLNHRHVPKTCTSSRNGSGVNSRLLQRASAAAAPTGAAISPSFPTVNVASRNRSEEVELAGLQRTQFATAAAARDRTLSKQGSAAGNMALGSPMDHWRYISTPGVGRQKAFGAGSSQLQRGGFETANTPIHRVNNADIEYPAMDARRNPPFPPGSSQSERVTNEFVPRSSSGSTVPSRDSLYTGNQSRVNQGNTLMLRTNPSVLDRANTLTAVSGNGNVQASDLSNAVKVGLSFSEMILSSLQSALSGAGNSALTSSTMRGRTDAVAFNSSASAKPATSGKAHGSTFSGPLVGPKSQAAVNNTFAHNIGSTLTTGTSQTSNRALYPRFTDRTHSSTLMPIGTTASYSFPPLTDFRQSQTTFLQQSRQMPMNLRHIMPAGTFNQSDAMHPPIAHTHVPDELPDRVNRMSIPRFAGARNNVMPPTHALSRDSYRAPVPRSRPPTENAERPGHIMVSKESQFLDTSMQPNALNYSAECLMISEQRKLMGIPLTEQNSYPLVRNTSDSQALVRGRTLRYDIPQEMRGKGRVSWSSSPSLKYQNTGEGLSSDSFDEMRAGSPEPLRSEHLYARREPTTAEAPKKRIIQTRKKRANTQQKQCGATRSTNTESFQEVVMTPLAKRLYTTEESNGQTGPTPVSRGISDGTSYRTNHCSTAAPTAPHEPQEAGLEPPSRTQPEQVSSSGGLKRSYRAVQGKYADPHEEILVSPLVKKLRTAGKTVPISKPRMTSRDIPATVCAPSSQINRAESVITHAARNSPVNYMSAMPVTDDETVNPQPPETSVKDPAVTINSGHLVPWSAPSTRTLSVDQGLNLRPEVEALPPFEITGENIYSGGIKEYWGAHSTPSTSKQEEDIRNIIEWLMHSATTSDELPSPHPSLLSITSGDSSGPPTQLSIASGDSECANGPAQHSITSGDSRRLSVPGQRLIKSGDSRIKTSEAQVSGDLEGTSGLGPVSTTSEHSAITRPAPVSITIGDSADHTGQSLPSNTSGRSASKGNEEIESSSPSDTQICVLSESSEFQTRVAKPTNRRKSTIPRKKRPKALKPPTIGGKIAKSPIPPSKKSIDHFIVVCGGEAFKVSSRVLEEASPVVKDFATKCLQAGPTGDCIFEVVGVTPWAMHELLKYLCRTSYNRTLLRSSYMRKLAEKLKINLNSAENTQQSANNPSSIQVGTELC